MIYLVGSWEETSTGSDVFVVGRITHDKERAIAYCDSRQNGEYDWAVQETPSGVDSDFFDWDLIHTTPKTKK